MVSLSYISLSSSEFIVGISVLAILAVACILLVVSRANLKQQLGSAKKFIAMQAAQYKSLQITLDQEMSCSRPAWYRLFGAEYEDYAVRLMRTPSGRLMAPVNASERSITSITCIPRDDIDAYMMKSAKQAMAGAPSYQPIHTPGPAGEKRILLLGEVFTLPLLEEDASFAETQFVET